MAKRFDANVLRWAALAAGCLLAAVLLSGVKAAHAAASATTSPAEQVEQAEQRFVEALVDGVRALSPLLADDFIYVTTSGTAITKAVLLAHLSSGATVVRRAERQQVQQVVRDGVVVTTGLLVVQVEQGGGLKSIPSRYLHVWVTSPAGWKLVARQAAEMPGSR